MNKDIERFNTKIIIQSNGCWHYSGAHNNDGYGMFWTQGRTIGAHRFSAEHLGNLPLKPFDCVCHTCDNPGCINPAHLFIGTNVENTADRHRKGRSVRGSQIGNSIHSEQIVKAIKDAYNSRPHYRGIFRDLSNEFNVSYGLVWYACRDRAWRHV